MAFLSSLCLKKPPNPPTRLGLRDGLRGGEEVSPANPKSECAAYVQLPMVASIGGAKAENPQSESPTKACLIFDGRHAWQTICQKSRKTAARPNKI